MNFFHAKFVFVLLKQGLPKHFCDSYLPKHDATITLVDEEGDEFETNYLAYKAGLSGGWQGFSVFHELIDGDALVFQLIEPTKFKVTICLILKKKKRAKLKANNLS